MKRIAFVTGLALVVVSLFAFGLLRRAPVRRTVSSPPRTIQIERGPTGDFRERLLEIIARAEAAAEKDSAILGKAQVVPDPSKNAVTRSFHSTIGY
jgi:hypothetical protein